MPKLRMSKRCPLCREFGTMDVTQAQARRISEWSTGKDRRSIQNALPDLTPAQREMLISGSHEKCFNEMFPPEEDVD